MRKYYGVFYVMQLNLGKRGLFHSLRQFDIIANEPAERRREAGEAVAF